MMVRQLAQLGKIWGIPVGINGESKPEGMLFAG
jgi:hypothetical protein